ncbi:MAG TPA: type II toxin-antitoxin system RelE/ParE family toxin [Candidatus Binatia bacterium]|nr:type II toxin-antitoxin system RelE/ParE family toxin [Candidatus Binatia bacterium]
MASDAPRFIVRPAAEADIEEAALWYELRSLGLGAEFLRSVDACFEQIRRSPQRFQQVYKDVRRARIRRFPYIAYFVSTGTSIQIVACMHAKRDPRTWQRRLDR